ncbi:transglutaminase domain-containing protein [Flavobacterium sp.]|uniref:transglutaminase domain-containing protein n=1 Tax=Flavobacterium sp. TaxID=239 RepID=UPI002623DFF5|nr:transglutaminase domain-containing protein [Flavobacterium sp.]
MKKSLPMLYRTFTAIILLFFQAVAAQDYSDVDSIVMRYPSGFSSTQKLADKINDDFSGEAEKARAIYTWIALNIRYDLAAMRHGDEVAFRYHGEADRMEKEKIFRISLAQKTIRSNKGICQNYAALFHNLCDMTGLKCLDIPGAAKTNLTQIGKLPQKNDHIWNAVKIGDSWNLVDVTWGAGSVDANTGKFKPNFNDGFFCTPPTLFFLNHFPEDKRLSMLDKTPEDFAELPLYYGEYVDSDYEILSPETGVLPTKTKTVPFRISDLAENDNISYTFSNQNKIIAPQLKRNGNVSEFEVNIGAADRGFLTLFVNNRSVAAYKIGN